MTDPAADPVRGILYFERDARAALELAALVGASASLITSHRFPDGELRIAVPAPIEPSVAIYATLDDPNEKLVALLLAARTAREQGARSLTLVAPYLCYMRQDIAFEPGQAVSQRIVGRFLAELFDSVVTVDPHLHRVGTLHEAVPATRAVSLSAAEPIAQFVRARVPDALLVGPDAESLAWVGSAAEHAGLEFAVCEKRRRGDRDVEVTLADRDYAGRAVVIVDDVASTGRTLATAAAALAAAGAASVDVAVTHALFVGDAIEAMRAAGVREIWSTDSVAHPSNRIALASLLAVALGAAGA